MKPTQLPGSQIETAITPGVADRQLTSLFSCGGLILSQVCQLTGLEGHTVQNWVKRKFLAPPVKKRYNRNQLCRLFNINLLKDIFTLEKAVKLLGRVDGGPCVATGDQMDDSRLYSCLIDCLAALDYPDRIDPGLVGDTVRTVASDIQSPHRGAELQLWLVLEIMLAACQAQYIRRRVLEMYGRLGNM